MSAYAGYYLWKYIQAILWHSIYKRSRIVIWAFICWRHIITYEFAENINEQRPAVRGSPVMSDSHYYAYGIIEDEEYDLDLEIVGVGGANRVYTVNYRSLAAVVSDIDTLEPEQTDENFRAHDTALRAVMEDGRRTVVPMRFGMVFMDARTLKNVLRGGRGMFNRALHEINGTVELGVKLIADEDATFDQEVIREDVADRLRDMSIQEVENGLFSDRLVMNRSYLVDHDQQAAFGAAIDEITEEHDDHLSVQYSGPWAPYNFIDIEIGTQQ